MLRTSIHMYRITGARARQHRRAASQLPHCAARRARRSPQSFKIVTLFILFRLFTIFTLVTKLSHFSYFSDFPYFLHLLQHASVACMRMFEWGMWCSKRSASQGAGGAYMYSGNTIRSPIEAPLISREVLPETYFLSVIMAADAQAGPFLQFQASCSCGTLWNFDFPGSFFDFWDLVL